MTIDWCIQKLAELQLNDGKVNILTEIRNRLSSNGPSEGVISNFLQSPALFDCLNPNSSPEQAQLAIDILSICLSSLQISTPNGAVLLERTLRHSNARIRGMVLHELHRSLQKRPDLTSMETDLTILIISCLSALETEVSAPAISVLSQILVSGYDDSRIQTSFLAKLEEEELVRLRVYEIAVNLSKTSPEMLHKMNYLLDKLLGELDTSDILLQFNVLELLVSLAEQNHGLVFMENQNVFKKISKRIEGFEENPLDKILIPGYMKFFGKIAYGQPQRIIEGYPNMIMCLFNCLISQDITILPTAFDTLANLAHSTDGKMLLDNHFSEKMKESFEEFASYLRNLPTNMKNHAFNTLEDIFRPSNDSNETIEKITEKWCNFLTMSRDLKFFLEFCKNPILDIKVSCLSFIRTLCSYQWATVYLKNTAGFVEYLLDRRVEFEKDARYIKYEINDILSKSSIFDGQTIVLLKKFVNEGPYYVEGIVEVAVEGGN